MKFQRERLIVGVIIDACMKNTASLSAIAGLIPGSSIGLDSAVLTAFNLKLLRSIAHVYGVTPSAEIDSKFISSMLGFSSGTFLTKSLFSWIPIAGSIINSVASSHFTNLVGWAIVVSIEKNGSLEPLNSKDIDAAKELQSKMWGVLKNHLAQFSKSQLKEIEETASYILKTEEQNSRESAFKKLELLLFRKNSSAGNSTP
jgi:uncharacterized protein (DUF697 family)